MPYPACPKCGSEFTYEDGNMLVCPMCFNEWNSDAEAEDIASVIRDANGNELQDGDDVVVIKDLKLGGNTIKQGSKAKSIRLLDVPVNGHDIEARVDGFGTIYLKSSLVKK